MIEISIILQDSCSISRDKEVSPGHRNSRSHNRETDFGIPIQKSEERMKKLKLVFFVVVVLSVLLSACGSPATSAPAAPAAATSAPAAPAAAATSAPAAPAAAGGKVTITYWSMWNESEPQADVLKGWMADFTKANPNVTFNVTWAGRQVLTKLQTAISAGQTVDLVDMEGPALRGGLVIKGQTVPMDKYLNQPLPGESAPWKSIFVPGTLTKLAADDGSLHIIPYELLTTAIWYDQRTFDKYKVQPPATWDDLMSICSTMKAADFPLFTVEGNGDTYAAMWFYTLIERMEGPGTLLKAAQDKTGALWDDPNFLKAAQLERSLWDNGCVIKGGEGLQWPAGQMALANGQAGAELVGSWLPNEVKASVDPGFTWRSFMVPNVPGGVGKSTDVEDYPLGWVILKSSTNPDVVASFLEMSMSKAHSQQIDDVAVNLSARADTTPPTALKDVYTAYNNATALFLPYDGTNSTLPDWFPTLMKYHLQMFTGQITPQVFIADMKQATIDYWKTH